MLHPYDYDLIWIGTGQATGTVLPRLQRLKKRVAVIEGGRFGGTCVNYGCSPTKTLVASARAAHVVRRAADFGVQTGAVNIDFARVMQRQNELRNNWSQSLEDSVRNMDNVRVYEGYAAFEDPHTVRVGGQVLTGESIVIHAGARARIPEIDGLADVPYLTNRELLNLTELPAHLVIIGGSYISMEFAQAFRRFGSAVTIIEGSPQLMFREDADIAQIAHDVLVREGVEILLNSKVERVAQEGQGVAVRLTQDGAPRTVSGSHLLLAVGRVPNSDTLQLAAAGVEQDARGFIPVNDHTQTNVPHIYAVGDINGRGAFTHTSVNDGEIFWDFYSGEGDRTLHERLLTYAMYIDPPLGRVGMSEKEARKSGKNVLMATRPMAQISRAIEKDETDGLIKLLVDADNEQFLGVSILGVGGDEIINMFAPFMLVGGTYKQFRRAVLTHPTVAELLPWILDDLQPLD